MASIGMRHGENVAIVVVFLVDEESENDPDGSAARGRGRQPLLTATAYTWLPVEAGPPRSRTPQRSRRDCKED